MEQYSPVVEILKTIFTYLKLRTLPNVKTVLFLFTGFIVLSSGFLLFQFM